MVLGVVTGGLVRRLANAVANWLAQQANRGVECENWANHPSLSLMPVLRVDRLPAPPNV